jgi:hypothetical protein
MPDLQADLETKPHTRVRPRGSAYRGTLRAAVRAAKRMAYRSGLHQVIVVLQRDGAGNFWAARETSRAVELGHPWLWVVRWGRGRGQYVVEPSRDVALGVARCRADAAKKPPKRAQKRASRTPAGDLFGV